MGRAVGQAYSVANSANVRTADPHYTHTHTHTHTHMHLVAVLDVQPDASHPVCPIVDAIVKINRLKLDP